MSGPSASTAMGRRVRAAGQGRRKRRGGAQARLRCGPGGGQAGGTDNPAPTMPISGAGDLKDADAPRNWPKPPRYFEQAAGARSGFRARLPPSSPGMYWDAENNACRGPWACRRDEINAKTHAIPRNGGKAPSPGLLACRRRSAGPRAEVGRGDRALQKAVALDPSDPWTTWISQALISNGRAADGLALLDSALRVDPGWTPWRYYLQGLAYFSQDRFTDAAASLEKIDFNPMTSGQGIMDCRCSCRLTAISAATPRSSPSRRSCSRS